VTEASNGGGILVVPLPFFHARVAQGRFFGNEASRQGSGSGRSLSRPKGEAKGHPQVGREETQGGGVMGGLRKVPFIIALLAIALVFCVETGSHFVKPPQVSPAQLRASIQAELEPGEPSPDVDTLLAARKDTPPTPGLAIPYLALLDGLLLFTVALIGVSILVPERLQARVQGVLTFIVTLLLLLGSIVLLFAAVALLLLMLGLFLAPPFGTIAYLALWGFFDRGGASATLGLLFFLKLVLGGGLLFAQPRFMQNKGLVLLVITSLLGNAVISFLHGVVPRILTSITDALAAILVAVFAALWAVVFLIGSLSSVLKALRVAKPGTSDLSG